MLIIAIWPGHQQLWGFELYETCDQDYSTVDGGIFLPRERQDAVLNQGIITDDLLGEVEIRFPVHDIKVSQ